MVTKGGFIFKNGAKGCLVFEEDRNGSLHQIGDLFSVTVEDVEGMTDKELQDCLNWNGVMSNLL